MVWPYNIRLSSVTIVIMKGTIQPFMSGHNAYRAWAQFVNPLSSYMYMCKTLHVSYCFRILVTFILVILLDYIQPQPTNSITIQVVVLRGFKFLWFEKLRLIYGFIILIYMHIKFSNFIDKTHKNLNPQKLPTIKHIPLQTSSHYQSSSTQTV